MQKFKKSELLDDLYVVLERVSLYSSLTGWILTEVHKKALVQGLLHATTYLLSIHKKSPFYNVEVFCDYVANNLKYFLEELQNPDDVTYADIFETLQAYFALINLSKVQFNIVIDICMIDDDVEDIMLQNRHLNNIFIDEDNLLVFKWDSPNYNPEEESPYTDPVYMRIDLETMKQIDFSNLTSC